MPEYGIFSKHFKFTNCNYNPVCAYGVIKEQTYRDSESL